ncbi:MAG: hypothetical protein AAGA70_18095 [Pseudomonadota bacterium]
MALVRPTRTALALACVAATIGLPASAQDAAAPAFQILAPPSTEWNIVFRLNRATGEVTGCAYVEDETGNATRCYPAVDHAQAGEAGPYVLAASHNPSVRSVYRLNERTGAISLCWVAGWKTTNCVPEGR